MVDRSRARRFWGALGRWLVPVGRFWYAAIFLLAPRLHYSHAGVVYAAQHGVPFPQFLVPASGTLAFLGGLSILLGWQTRIGSWLIVAFLVPVTLSMHDYWTIADLAQAQVQQTMFMKNFSMLGGALVMTCTGAGPYSLDDLLRSRRAG